MVIPNIINLVIPNIKSMEILMLENVENYNSLPEPEYSVKHRKRINRLFREVVGSPNIPYPEVDNCFELTRSKIIFDFKSKIMQQK